MSCAVMALIYIGSGLSGCQGASDQPVVGAGSKTATGAPQARSMKQLEQETERMRMERDRLKAELSQQGTQATQSPSTRVSATTARPPLPWVTRRACRWGSPNWPPSWADPRVWHSPAWAAQ